MTRAPDTPTQQEIDMQNPAPIHLMTPTESRARGWQAESRDEDGHLCSQHAPFECDDELLSYVRHENERGKTVTIWPIAARVQS